MDNNIIRGNILFNDPSSSYIKYFKNKKICDWVKCLILNIYIYIYIDIYMCSHHYTCARLIDVRRLKRGHYALHTNNPLLFVAPSHLHTSFKELCGTVISPA